MGEKKSIEQERRELLQYVNTELGKMKESGEIERVDPAIPAFEKEVLRKPNLMTPQEAGRATYKTATPNKDGMKLIIDEAKLAQAAREGFKEMGQEEK